MVLTQSPEEAKNAKALRASSPVQVGSLKLKSIAVAKSVVRFERDTPPSPFCAFSCLFVAKQSILRVRPCVNTPKLTVSLKLQPARSARRSFVIRH